MREGVWSNELKALAQIPVWPGNVSMPKDCQLLGEEGIASHFAFI